MSSIFFPPSSLTAEEIANNLTRMYLKTTIQADGKLAVEIPPNRHDVIHPCDIYEDVAISHGYNNIKRTLPSTMHFGRQFPLNKLTEQLREQVAQAGFSEALTFSLVKLSVEISSSTNVLMHSFICSALATMCPRSSIEKSRTSRLCILAIQRHWNSKWHGHR